MSDLRDLYQEVILDHNRRPRNRGALAAATHRAEGFNPLCGDRLVLELAVRGDRIEEVRFEGEGCAISTAAASLMTEAVKGRSLPEVERLHAGFQGLVTGRPSAAPADLGALEALGGVAEFPMRVKCATLCWHTLKAALRGGEQVATTE